MLSTVILVPSALLHGDILYLTHSKRPPPVRTLYENQSAVYF
jgi:hypothetical protein